MQLCFHKKPLHRWHVQDCMAWTVPLSEFVLDISEVSTSAGVGGGAVNRFFFPKKYDQSLGLISPSSWMGKSSCSERGPHLLSLYQFQVHCSVTGSNLHENVALAACPSPSGLPCPGIVLALQPWHSSGLENLSLLLGGDFTIAHEYYFTSQASPANVILCYSALPRFAVPKKCICLPIAPACELPVWIEINPQMRLCYKTSYFAAAEL